MSNGTVMILDPWRHRRLVGLGLLATLLALPLIPGVAVGTVELLEKMSEPRARVLTDLVSARPVIVPIETRHVHGRPAAATHARPRVSSRRQARSGQSVSYDLSHAVYDAL